MMTDVGLFVLLRPVLRHGHLRFALSRLFLAAGLVFDPRWSSGAGGFMMNDSTVYSEAVLFQLSTTSWFA